MKNRNPIAVALLPLITLGIYSLYWMVKTKGEMNSKGANIPTAWLIIIPLVNIWWTWKYSEGVEQVTGSKMSTIIAFILLMLLGSIGNAVIQHTFNGIDPATNSGTDTVGPTVSPAEPEAVQATATLEQAPAVEVSTPPNEPGNPTPPPVA